MRPSSSADSDGLPDAARAELLRIARAAIVARLGGAPEAGPSNPLPAGPAEIEALGAVFVTLKIRGERPGDPEHLRGCIGTLEATEPLARAVAENAVRAAFEDPRFPPLDAEELDRVTIHLSLLEPRRRITGAADIRVGVDGVVLESGSNRGVFLPQVAVEQRWSAEQLLEQLSRKAGLDDTGWKTAEIFTFGAVTFGE